MSRSCYGMQSATIIVARRLSRPFTAPSVHLFQRKRQTSDTHREKQRMSARKSLSGISRRMVVKAGAFISVYPAPQLLAQTLDPLKIGFLTVLTGPLAAGGQQQQEGAGFFLSERDGMIAGRGRVDHPRYVRESGVSQNKNTVSGG